MPPFSYTILTISTGSILINLEPITSEFNLVAQWFFPQPFPQSFIAHIEIQVHVEWQFMVIVKDKTAKLFMVPLLNLGLVTKLDISSHAIKKN